MVAFIHHHQVIRAQSRQLIQSSVKRLDGGKHTLGIHLILFGLHNPGAGFRPHGLHRPDRLGDQFIAMRQPNQPSALLPGIVQTGDGLPRPGRQIHYSPASAFCMEIIQSAVHFQLIRPHLNGRLCQSHGHLCTSLKMKEVGGKSPPGDQNGRSSSEMLMGLPSSAKGLFGLKGFSGFWEGVRSTTFWI